MNKVKFWTVALGFVTGVGVSACGIYLKAPQLAVFVVSGLVTAGIIVGLNRRG